MEQKKTMIALHMRNLLAIFTIVSFIKEGSQVALSKLGDAPAFPCHHVQMQSMIVPHPTCFVRLAFP